MASGEMTVTAAVDAVLDSASTHRRALRFLMAKTSPDNWENHPAIGLMFCGTPVPDDIAALFRGVSKEMHDDEQAFQRMAGG